MDDSLRGTAERVRGSLPCSVELPAGTGKTQVVAGLVALAEERDERVLVLTHTNAGVDAMRRRLRKLGVGSATARVDTIASWSFGLIRKYPVLSGITVAFDPVWSQSDMYYVAAAAAVRSRAIRSVLKASYDFVIVDEYQDCVVEQHVLICTLYETLPVCVFGDPLQSIFGFGQNVTVKWMSDVVTTWPAVSLPIFPWRWHGHNEKLGKWLINIRQDLYAGNPIDLRCAPLRWYPNNSYQASTRACFDQPTDAGSVVAIGQFEADTARLASRLNGSYGMMEELEGNFMLKFAAIVDAGRPEVIAPATLKFAKNCTIGVAAKLDSPVGKKLDEGKSVTNLKRGGAERQLELLSQLLANATPARVYEALQSIADMDGVRLYRREAWRDMLKALIVAASSDGLTITQAISRIRNRARIIGRGTEKRVVSRSLLIKGLEYDRAVVLDADAHSPFSLYVALTRARQGLTVVSRDQVLRPSRPDLG